MQPINENIFKQNISQKIKKFRKDTQEKTAENACISIDTLSNIERGLNIPSSLTLINLCNSLNVLPNDLLEDFITDKDKLLNSKINSAFNDLNINEKEFILYIINFIKSNNSKI